MSKLLVSADVRDNQNTLFLATSKTICVFSRAQQSQRLCSFSQISFVPSSSLDSFPVACFWFLYKLSYSIYSRADVRTSHGDQIHLLLCTIYFHFHKICFVNKTKQSLQINNVKLNIIMNYLKQNGLNKHITPRYINNVSFSSIFTQSFLLLS